MIASMAEMPAAFESSWATVPSWQEKPKYLILPAFLSLSTLANSALSSRMAGFSMPCKK
jgi:hypothetical protein